MDFDKQHLQDLAELVSADAWFDPADEITVARKYGSTARLYDNTRTFISYATPARVLALLAENARLRAKSPDWQAYHSALSQCAELLDNMADEAPLVDAPKYLAAKLATPAAAAPQQAVPEGWKPVIVNEAFDDLMYWLERSNNKGNLNDDLIAPWEAFDYQSAESLAAAPVAAIEQPPEVQQGAWIAVDDKRKPTGRTPILVAVACIKFGEHDDGTPFEHRSVEVNEGEFIPPNGENGNYFTSYCTPQADQEWVTHWMPLPPAPEFPHTAGAAREGGVTCNDTPDVRTQPPADSQHKGNE